MSDIRQSRSYATYLQTTGWKICSHKGSYYYIKKLPVLGSFLKVQRIPTIDLKYLGAIQKRYRVFQTVVEPSTDVLASELIAQGYRRTTPFVPSKTLVISLTSPLSAIKSAMHKDARRTLDKPAPSMRIYAIHELSDFHKAWKKAVKNKEVLSVKKLTALFNAFPHSLFVTSSDSESGAIFLVANTTGYYWKGFTSPVGRQKLHQYHIVWHGITWAKKAGATLFDFEGVYDDRFPIAAWKGFTHFKESFGGHTTAFPGAYQKLRIPLPAK